MKNVTDKLRLTLVISLSEILFGGFSMFSNARNYYKTYILLTSIVLSVTQILHRLHLLLRNQYKE